MYENCRKSLEVKNKKNMVYRVSKNDSANHRFAECQEKTLGKGLTAAALCRVLLFVECSTLGKPPLCRVLSLWHSVNSLFAEYSIKRTRQSLGHSAKKPSPIVKSPLENFTYVCYSFVQISVYLTYIYINSSPATRSSHTIATYRCISHIYT